MDQSTVVFLFHKFIFTCFDRLFIALWNKSFLVTVEILRCLCVSELAIIKGTDILKGHSNYQFHAPYKTTEIRVKTLHDATKKSRTFLYSLNYINRDV